MEKLVWKKLVWIGSVFYFFPTNLWADFHQKLYSSILAPFKSNKKNCKSFAAFVLEETWEIICFLVNICFILRIPLQRLGRFSCGFQQKTQNFKLNLQTLKFFWIYSTAAPEIQKNCVFNQKKTERKQWIYWYRLNIMNTVNMKILISTIFLVFHEFSSALIKLN